MRRKDAQKQLARTSLKTLSKPKRQPSLNHSLSVVCDANLFGLFSLLYLSVDGGLSQWTSWSPCSKSCGGGTSVRTRQCNSPPPSPGGNPCTGKTFESKDCNIHVCPGEIFMVARKTFFVCFTAFDLIVHYCHSVTVLTLQ